MKNSYIKTKFKNLVNVTEIVTIHYYEFDRNFAFDGESHDFWEMVYVDKGPVEVESNDKKVILNQGDIIFHKPNEFHAIKAHNTAPDFFVISFVCKSAAMQLFEGYHTSLNKNLKPFLSSIMKEANDTYVIPKNDIHLKKLIKKKDAQAGGEQLIKMYLEQFLIMLIRVMSNKKEISVFPSKESMETHIVAAVKKYIHENLNKKIYIEEICHATGYSKSYLCRLFQMQCGTTIGNYITTKKISMAKELIRQHTYNFTEISEMLSFDNPQYFARTFKRTTGMTPSEFKHSLNSHNKI